MSDSREHELGDEAEEKPFFKNKTPIITNLSMRFPPDIDARIRMTIAEYADDLYRFGITTVVENHRSGVGEPKISAGNIDADVDKSVPACDDILYLRPEDLKSEKLPEILRGIVADLEKKQAAEAAKPVKSVEIATYVAHCIFPVTTHQHSIELARGSNNGEVFNVLDLQGRYAGITIIMPENFRKTATVAILAMGITNPNKIIWEGLYSEFPKKAKAIQNEIAAIISEYKRSKA